MPNPPMPINPTSQKYFFGRISREMAADFLNQNGCREGQFLLREKTETGNYALSICHDGSIHHYSIEKQPDNTVMIVDGRKFAGPIELIEHHKTNLDGFLTHPTIPLNRPDSGYPIAWPGVTYAELEKALYNYARDANVDHRQLENIFGPQRQKALSKVAKTLHRGQPWFHGKIKREDAERVLKSSGHHDGKYLVREKEDSSFALSLSFQQQTKHYKIHSQRMNGEEKLAIEDGPKFDCLIDMIAHYYNKKDGLLCSLNTPVPNKKTRFPIREVGNLNSAYGHLPDQVTPVSSGKKWWPSINRVKPPVNRPLPPMPVGFDKGEWDEPENTVQSSSSAKSGGAVGGSTSDEDIQKIYDFVPRTEDVFNLNEKDLKLQETLGGGNFGDVMKGEFKLKGRFIPVAVKTLKKEDIPNADNEIMHEAKLMADLQHRNIVRLIGVCTSGNMKLVMELAQLGPLNKYLKTHPSLHMQTIIELMAQVAEGMSYLESKNFVHRDLAARNVLLVSESFAKISDFGMSKALGLGNNYYKAETAGKWPLKWYAPECIFYFRFDTKSDIWSYGVTLWEATAYGAKPYRGLKGQQILSKIEEGERLQKPQGCPSEVYEVMLACWQYQKEDRPTFSEIAELVRTYQKQVRP